MDEETSDKTLILRIVNNKRYKEYFVKVRKRVPVYGADFEKPTVYNFSGDNIYSDYADAASTVVLLMMANMYWLSAELHNLIFLKYRI